jgi:hypothetical protein
LPAWKAVGLRLGCEACVGGDALHLSRCHVPGEAVGMGDDAVILAVGAGLSFGCEEGGEDQTAEGGEAEAEVG